MPKMILKVLNSEFTIHRFRSTNKIPAAVFDGSFYWIGKTDEELSVVCDSSIALAGGKKKKGWACLKVPGPIDFSETGILAGISSALASAGISIFAVSTFDTDYILLPAAHLDKAKGALVESGYGVEDSQSNQTAAQTDEGTGYLPS